MIVVAVEDLDVDSGLSHPAREFAELTGFSLVQSLDHDVALFDDADAGCFERAASGRPIFEEEVGDSLTVDNERASALDAHSGAAQCVAHLGQCAGPVLKRDR